MRLHKVRSFSAFVRTGDYEECLRSSETERTRIGEAGKRSRSSAGSGPIIVRRRQGLRRGAQANINICGDGPTADPNPATGSKRDTAAGPRGGMGRYGKALAVSGQTSESLPGVCARAGLWVSPCYVTTRASGEATHLRLIVPRFTSFSAEHLLSSLEHQKAVQIAQGDEQQEHRP